MVTLDTRMMPWRPRDLAGAYLPFLRGEGIANYTSDPVFRSKLDTPPEEDMQPSIQQWATRFESMLCLPGAARGVMAGLRGEASLAMASSRSCTRVGAWELVRETAEVDLVLVVARWDCGLIVFRVHEARSEPFTKPDLEPARRSPTALTE